MQPVDMLFDGADQLFKKWEEPLHTAADRKLYPYHTLILATLKEGFPRLILTTPRLPFNLPAQKASLERITCIAFNISFLSFIRIPYLARINNLFTRNATGWEFPPGSVGEVTGLIHLLSNSYSAGNLATMMQILDALSASEPECILADTSVKPDAATTREVEKQKRTEMIIRYIHDHYRRRLTLAEVAEHVGLSYEHLSAVCRDCLPGGFSGYLLQVRFDEVTRQLAYTDYSILSIAEDCGFNNFASFMELFKKRYGTTPARYRKQLIVDS